MSFHAKQQSQRQNTWLKPLSLKGHLLLIPEFPALSAMDGARCLPHRNWL